MTSASIRGALRAALVLAALLAAPLAGADPGEDLDADGWTVEHGDCDDENGAIHPGSVEICDGLDNRCAGALDPIEADVDEDGFATCGGDCDDGDAAVFPGASEAANAVDDDCDARIDEGTEWVDDDGDRWAERDGDCDDSNASLYPGADDGEDGTVDGVDDDCDTLIDEGLTDQDRDGDGVTPLEGDCDDEDASVYVGAEEVNDGVDNDCDGVSPPSHGCGTGGEALLLFPFVGLGGLRRRRRGGSLIGALLGLGALSLPGSSLAAPPVPGSPPAGAPSARAEAPQEDDWESFQNRVLEAEAAYDRLLMLAALERDASGARAGWDARIARQRAELDREVEAAGSAADPARVEAARQRLDRSLAVLRGLEVFRADLAATAPPAGTMDAELRRVSELYARLVRDSVDRPLVISNSTWSSLFWCSGTAAILAGDIATGEQLLQQAAAVSIGPPAADTLPPSVAPHLVAARTRLGALAKGKIKVTGAEGVTLTLDGVAVPSERREIETTAGDHRLTFLGNVDEPIVVRLVPVIPGGTTSVEWIAPVRVPAPSAPVASFDADLEPTSVATPTAVAPLVTSTPMAREPGRLWFGAGPVGLAGHATRALGGEVALRYRLDLLEVVAECAWLATESPIWVQAGHEANGIGHLAASGSWVVSAGPVAFSAGAGAWTAPLLGGGPLARVGVEVSTGDLAIGWNGRFGWDAAFHDEDVQRWEAVSGLAVWITPAVR